MGGFIRRRRLFLVFAFVVLSAVGLGIARTVLICCAPPPTFQLTFTPTADVTLVPETPRFVVDTIQSVFRYTASGQGILGIAQLPGIFKLSGWDVLLVPEGVGYRVKVAIQIDGNTATAVNGLLLSTLRQVLEIDANPYADFIGDATTLVTLEALEKDGVEVVISGTLELVKKTRQVELPVRLMLKDGVLSARGTVSLDLGLWDIHVPTAIMSSTIRFEAEIYATKPLQP
ncbi:MAG TPA: YceI family protein [Aggregatilineales bacterium]|nr:YceI family protein [Anaerolineales bacterium]HRE47665.1 YceI family protein [Aggregatilineales bacterium]